MDLIRVEKQIEQLNKKKELLQKTYAEQLNKIQTELDELATYKKSTAAGLDMEKVFAAKEVFLLSRLPKILLGDQETTQVLGRIKKDVLEDCKLMRENYFGCKSYDRFRNQSVIMKYGYGPTYGTVFWEIGLLPEFRYSNREIPIAAKEGLLYIINILSSEDGNQYKQYL